MNEKIKELAVQSGYGTRWTSTEQFERFMEKFAEYIVRDCIEQCNVNFVGTIGLHPSAHNRGVKKCIDNIKEHFGVK